MLKCYQILQGRCVSIMKKIFVFGFSLILLFGIVDGVVAEEKTPIKEGTDAKLNQLIVSLTPKSQSINGAERATWTVRAVHNFGRLPISYTLNPGDGSRPYQKESFSTNETFNHRYDPSGYFQRFEVRGFAAFDYGLGEDSGTVTWTR